MNFLSVQGSKQVSSKSTENEVILLLNFCGVKTQDYTASGCLILGKTHIQDIGKRSYSSD